MKDGSLESDSRVTELLDLIKPFAEAAEGVPWEHTSDDYHLFPVNSVTGNKFVTNGDFRRAMEIYHRYRKKL